MPTPDPSQQPPPRSNIDANAPFTHEELVAYFTTVRDRDIDTLQQCLYANPALTEARADDGVLSLRGAPFAEALRQPPGPHSSTALYFAAPDFLDARDEPPRTLDVVRVLLGHGADPDAIGFNENTDHCAPIVVATWEGGIDKMRLLLEAGADVSGDQGIQALSTAASHDSTDRFDLLLQYGAQASPWMVVKAGLTDRVIALIDADPSLLSATDGDGYSLLQAAAGRIKYDGFERLAQAGRQMVEAMIERGAHVDAFTAAALNDVDRLRALLQSDPAQALQVLPDGNTPVTMAVQARSNEALLVLLEAGARPEPEALRWAARMDYTEACRALLNHGAQVNDEITLSATWRNQDPACVELILAHGGNPNAVNGWGTLHWVAAGNAASVQLLLDAGADSNMRAPGVMNNTPLHHAANNPDSTARLLAAGADPLLTNANGDTPLDLAQRDSSQEVVDLLKKHWHEAEDR